MKREEIERLLPHREPMLLIDDVEMEGDVAVGHYRVRGDEFFLQGHFPDRPIVPGVIVCEIMAQSSALLVGDLLEGRILVYAGLDNIRFRAELHPHDRVEVRSKIVDRRGMLFFVDDKAAVEGNTICNGRIAFKLVDR